MRLDIRYVTRFRYGGPVVESQNELRACPATDEHQQLVHYHVTTSPASRVSSYVDYWGTHVDTFGVRAPHEALEVVAQATVETHERTLPDMEVPLQGLGDPAWRDLHLEHLRRSPHVDWGAGVEVFARDLTDGVDDALARLVAIDAGVGGLTYRRGGTEVGVPVERVLEARSGVCQDFAHLMIAAARVVGLPARYVSGYFFTADESTGAEVVGDEVEVETHAWVEVALPGLGWVAFDPTNRLPVGPRHVAIGRGRDYDDVAPLRGVFNGAVDHELEVGVTMRRLALEPLGRPGGGTTPGPLLGLVARTAGTGGAGQ